ncbi:MAG: hypothetical protein COA42_16305 [Alteromonadaceae bacterium]|nr:MAG: hypothetical protein COA42_16305 [Alteromonadaceae bacterium]
MNTDTASTANTRERLSRRQLAKGLLALCAIPFIGLTSSCESMPPREFQTGAAKAPPYGCQQLRADDPRGDC